MIAGMAKSQGIFFNATNYAKQSIIIGNNALRWRKVNMCSEQRLFGLRIENVSGDIRLIRNHQKMKKRKK